MILPGIRSIALLAASLAGPLFARTPSLIPQPVTLTPHGGVFRITPATSVVAESSAAAGAEQLIEALAPAMGFRLKRITTDPPEADAIIFSLKPALRERHGDEGYALDVSPRRIELRAGASAGLFYGFQTLRQLLPAQVFSRSRVEGVAWTVPCVSITDRPRFRWRGLLIDPARHFIPVADFKHYLDAMAAHKFNRLQVHLTDNEGWRVEIKKYPKLTELGSRMDWSTRRKSPEASGPRQFYRQEEIRELVRYAAERHITIVPEIEMPYHAGAAIVAYPEHGVNTKRLVELPPEKRWSRSGGLLGPRPETVAFLEDVLSEVIDLFPSRFIHIGGDEANLEVWAGDPEMRALMAKLGCKDTHELHSWFIRQMDAFLTRRGRRMVGWDEILQGGLAPGATVMSWRGVEGGITAAKAGHDVVMAPTSHTYFDYRQHPDELGLGRQVTTVEKVYTFEPIPAELGAAEARHVLGGQGQLWGELIADPKRRDFMTWPRACALTERLWSPADQRDVDLFLGRLVPHLERLEAAGIGYRPLDG